jgi:hypothetical protein
MNIATLRPSAHGATEAFSGGLLLRAARHSYCESPRQVDLTLRFSRRNVRYLHI